MELTLFSDPHIGTRRAAHTTRESAKRLAGRLYYQALDIVSSKPNPVCGGDLFDRSFNDEDTLVQGYNIASRCLLTLAGNHDETNREGTVTSLRALKAMDVPIVAVEDLTTPYFTFYPFGLYVVPHHATQDLFEVAMIYAADHALRFRDGKPAVLLLHCNYDASDVMLHGDATLNLTAAMAERLLQAFDYIFLGHEHQPATHFDGRVVVMGNTHPTSFSDISDKFTYRLTIEDDRVDLAQEKVWSKDSGYREVEYGKPLPDLHGAQFIDVVGLAEAGQSVAVSDFIQEVWQAAGPSALAVRNNVAIGVEEYLDDVVEKPVLADIRSRIASELEGSDLLPLFNQLASEVPA